MSAKDLIKAADRVAAVPAKIKQAEQRALATTARQARSEMVKAVREDSGLPARYVGGKVFGRRVGEAAEVGAPKQGAIPLVAYPHKPVPVPPGRRGKGYQVRLSPTAWTHYPHVFPVLRRNTKFGPLLFEREGSERYPIRVVTAAPVSDYFLAQAPAIAEAGGQFYSIELARQIKLLNP